ncbi:transposase, partial [Bacillaceae bacterium Marseille-Q3522]|nr:transposase [Bacillaceae bacterium Marseille-Q3522]
ITVEKLNVDGMRKNKHLAKSISNQGFYDFKLKLVNICNKLGIELREVTTFYPSSKLCSCCGNKKADLKLSDRIYQCDHCGMVINRDLNAAINLKYAKEFKILA